jgi:hypothetical protein
LQVLGQYTSRAHQLASSSSSGTQVPVGSQLQQDLQMGVRALITEAAAASILAKHSSHTAADRAALAQQHHATAVQDFSTAVKLLQLLEGAPDDGVAGQVSGQQSSSNSSSSYWHSSNVNSQAKTLLDFGLLCSHLHQQQQEQQTNPSPAWSAAAAAVVSSAGGFAALAVQNLLAAMAAAGASSNEPSIHVPTVLAALQQQQQQQSGTSNAGSSAAAACAAFAAGWGAVPLHVFLPWTSQLLARLGDTEGDVLQQPLEAMASRCVLGWL